MGIPKSFNFLGCSEVTFVLRDFKTVTGKIIKDFDDRKYDYGKHDDYKKDDDCKKDDYKKDDYKKDDYKKDDDKCCPPPKVDVKVDVDDKCDFILVELTREAGSVSLQEIEIDGGLEIEWVNVEFRRGTCVAINVCDILYAGVNAEIDEEEIEIGLGLGVTAETEAAK